MVSVVYSCCNYIIWSSFLTSLKHSPLDVKTYCTAAGKFGVFDKWPLGWGDFICMLLHTSAAEENLI